MKIKNLVAILVASTFLAFCQGKTTFYQKPFSLKYDQRKNLTEINLQTPMAFKIPGKCDENYQPGIYTNNNSCIFQYINQMKDTSNPRQRKGSL